MSKIGIFMADGCEEIEGLTVVDIVRRAGLDIETISINGKKNVTSSHKVTVIADLLYEEADFDSYKKGVEMMFSGFMDTMKKLGVEPFGEAGEKFDPNFHNAVMHCEDESLEENVITDVFSKGYKLGDKVLRPAMVKVAN